MQFIVISYGSAIEKLSEVKLKYKMSKDKIKEIEQEKLGLIQQRESESEQKLTLLAKVQYLSSQLSSKDDTETLIQLQQAQQNEINLQDTLKTLSITHNAEVSNYKNQVFILLH